VRSNSDGRANGGCTLQIRTLDLEEAAAYLKLEPRTLMGKVQRHEIPGRRLDERGYSCVAILQTISAAFTMAPLYRCLLTGRKVHHVN